MSNNTNDPTQSVYPDEPTSDSDLGERSMDLLGLNDDTPQMAYAAAPAAPAAPVVEPVTEAAPAVRGNHERALDEGVWESGGAHLRGGADPFDEAPPADLPPWYEDEYYDDEWGRLPQRSSTIFRVLLFLVGFLAILVITFLVVKRWVDVRLDPPGEPGEELVIVEIPSDATTDDVASILADEGVVPDATVFRYWLRYKGWREGDPLQFEAGKYDFRNNMSVYEAREVLEGPRRNPDQADVTIPEGLTNAELVERLVAASVSDSRLQFEEQALRDALAQAPAPGLVSSSAGAFLLNNEGIFFPSTYAVDESVFGNEIAMVNILLRQFETVALETNLADGFVDNEVTGEGEDQVIEEIGSYSAYQVLIVASLIEEEAQVPEDRAKIARVIYNRLAAGIPLGIDATTLYAKAGNGDRVLTQAERTLFQSDLDNPSPWNTRNIANVGLPPSPIASPGRAALEAALNPVDGPWLFYVLTNENGPGSHTFATTDAEFEAAVQLCRDRNLGC